MIISLLQFLTAVVLIGWFWAQYWSYMIVKKAYNNDQNLINAASRQPAAAAEGQFSDSNDFYAGGNQR